MSDIFISYVRRSNGRPAARLTPQVDRRLSGR
jgi:hypothetical protein